MSARRAPKSKQPRAIAPAGHPTRRSSEAFTAGKGWSLPAGAVEPGEASALAREVDETQALAYLARDDLPALAFPYPPRLFARDDERAYFH